MKTLLKGIWAPVGGKLRCSRKCPWLVVEVRGPFDVYGTFADCTLFKDMLDQNKGGFRRCAPCIKHEVKDEK